MTISAIRFETWEAINRILLASARREKVEVGKVARLDSTVTAALMHEPSDSSLLWDAVRVMVRLLKGADALIGVVWRNHRRAAKKRARAIEFTRGRPNRVPPLPRADQADAGDPGLCRSGRDAVMAGAGPDEGGRVASRVPPLSSADRADHRPNRASVLRGEAVAANEKIVSLFEPQADIIVKGGREDDCIGTASAHRTTLHFCNASSQKCKD